MMDLVCLVADKNMEAAISGLLARPRALGMRSITAEILVHPRRDPGCFHQAPELLSGYRTGAKHALVIFDHAREGVPAVSAAEVERLAEEQLLRAGMGSWALAVVIEPELEVWVFSDSPHVASAVGWADREPGMRPALEAANLWEKDASKPSDPKAALEWALREARRPRSSSIYRDLARRVSTKRCQDRSFVRLQRLLRDWFPQIRSNDPRGD